MITILRGVSGAGKSTWLTQNRPLAAAAVWSADEYFMLRGRRMGKPGHYAFDPELLSVAHGWCLRGFVEALRGGCEHIAVDNTNATVAELAPYVALCGAFEREYEIVRLYCPIEVAVERTQHGVPTQAISRQERAISDERLPPWWSKETIVKGW